MAWFPTGMNMGSLLLLDGSEFQLPLQLLLGPGWEQKILTPGSTGAPTASSLEEVDSLSLSSA